MKTERVATIYGLFESWSGDLITGQLKRFSAHTRNELAMLRRFVRPGDRVLDIGAHVGTFAVPLALFAGPDGRVVAFEASPDNFALLRTNVGLNSLADRIECHLGVVTDRRGSFARRRDDEANSGMWYFVPAAGGEAKHTAIQLDEWLAGRPDLDRIDVVKVDVEGAELHVLRACAHTLATHRPVVYLEVNSEALARFGVTPRDVGKHLADLGYRFFRNAGDRNSAHDRFRIVPLDAVEAGGEFYDVLAIPAADDRCREAERLADDAGVAPHAAAVVVPSVRPPRFTVCCVVDDDPRFHVELVLWAIAAGRHLPRADHRLVVSFVERPVDDLAEWLVARGVDVRVAPRLVAESPHCNKIAPFLDGHDTDYTIVCDTDVFFVDDPAGVLRGSAIRAAPNNHCNPPGHVFRRLLGHLGRADAYRPTVSLLPGQGGQRETYRNNISAGVVAVPAGMCRDLAAAWLDRARWLVAHRPLIEPWGVHVDQIGFALAMLDIGQDVDFLPPNVNLILHMLDQLDTAVAFHLTSGHIPLFPMRFAADRTLVDEGLTPAMRTGVSRLNDAIREAVAVIGGLPSTRGQLGKFLNPRWKR